MKYCSNCGTGLSDDALFCSNCGSSQKESATPIVQPAPQAEPAPQPVPQPAVQSETPMEPVNQTPPASNNAYVPQQPYTAQQTYTAQQPYVTQQPYATQQPYTAQQPYANPAPAYNPIAAPKKSKAPFVIIGIIVAIIILLVVLITKVGFGGGGYESAFKNFCQAINSQDINKLYKVMPPSTETAMKSLLSIGGMDDEAIFDEMFGYMGDDIKLDYEIIEAEQMDSDDLADYQDSLLGDEVTDGYYVEVLLIITVDGETEEETDEMAVVKIGNRWCFADFMF